MLFYIFLLSVQAAITTAAVARGQKGGDSYGGGD